MLELKSVSKHYATMDISNLSLAIGDGEYVVLLGPSGVGKTVLIEMIAGLIKPDAGRIFWDGDDISSLPPEFRQFAVVYQDYALFPHMTVEQNIGYGLRTRGISALVMKERTRTLAELLDISSLLPGGTEILSGGEQQRVALARALAVEPRLLLLDEPLSALDIRLKRSLQIELKRINREFNLPVLHVTHDAEEALRLADRICLMLDGEIIQIAAPQELFRHPTHYAIAQFLGLENLIPLDIARTTFPTLSLQEVTPAATHLWIRPEEIRLQSNSHPIVECCSYPAQITAWEYRDHFVAVQHNTAEITMSALMPYAAFHALRPHIGDKVQATFSEEAVHLLQ